MLKDTLSRYAVATVGLFLVAFGVALSIKSNLGTAPISCPAYVLSLKFPSISVGTFIFLVNMVFMLVQVALLRSRFRASSLMQVAASILFGYLVDVSLWMLSGLDISSLLAKALLVVLAGLVTAVGVSIEVRSNAWMLSAEMTVAALSTVTGGAFHKVKILMDSSLVVIAALLSLAFFGNPFGSGELAGLRGVADSLLARADGVVIGAGTLALAVLPGFFMKFTERPVGAAVDKLLFRSTDRSA